MGVRRPEGTGVGNDELVCAACAGRVVDGGCPTCRLSRQDLAAPSLPAEAFLLLGLLLIVLLVLTAQLS